jgi:hypothetical protein
MGGREEERPQRICTELWKRRITSLTGIFRGIDNAFMFDHKSAKLVTTRSPDVIWMSGRGIRGIEV